MVFCGYGCGGDVGGFLFALMDVFLICILLLGEKMV